MIKYEMIKVWKTGRERDRDREKPGKWGSTPGAPLRCFAIDETPAPATPVKWPLFDLTTPETSPFLPSQSARPHMYTLTHPHTHTHTPTHTHTNSPHCPPCDGCAQHPQTKDAHTCPFCAEINREKRTDAN